MFLLERFQKRFHKPKHTSSYRLHEYKAKPWKRRIAERLAGDGLFCHNKQHWKWVSRRTKRIIYLEINHIDGNPDPDLEEYIPEPDLIDLENLNLWCELCQKKQGGMMAAGLVRSKNVGVSRSVFLPTFRSDNDRRENIRGDLIGEGPRANDVFEPDWLAWSEAQMRKAVFQGQDFPTSERLKNEGAFVVKCSPKSTGRYYAKVVTPLKGEDDDRPYMEYRDELKDVRVKPKSRVVEAWKASEASVSEQPS